MTNSLPSDQTLLDPLAADHRSGFVAVVGRPNVGKSTLVNRLVGQKIAIVSPRPQTTRNRLLGILTRSDAQVIFVDTPGIHRPLHRLGEVLVETAAAALPDADAVLWLADVSVPPTDEDRQVAALLVALGPRVPVILGLNKADLLRPELVRERVAAYTALTRTIGWEMVSAARGDNLEHLLDRVVAALPPGPRLYGEDEVTDQQVRFMAGELVREQALRHLRDEVPHAVAVLVNEFKVRSEAPEQTPAGPAAPDTVRGGLTYIAATIYVERDSQRGILLGEGGQMLKKIGQGARLAIEELLETRVYLDLWVKVRPKWRADPDELRRLGYQLPKSKSGKGGTRHRKIVSVR